MAVRYNVIPRRNPRDPDAPPKYYPSIVTNGRVTQRQLSERAAEISTVSSVDTMAVLEALLTLIPREIANGNIVELGDFGSFRLRVQSEGEETAETVNANSIINVKPLFAPGKEFKKALKAADFVKVNR